MILLVTGGREYANIDRVFEVLDGHSPDIIIEGGAKGADHLARLWAKDRGIPYATVPAHWDTKGRMAGPLRNEWMLRLKPDLVVAFPGGTGTADMVRRAKKAGVEVVLVTDE